MLAAACVLQGDYYEAVAKAIDVKRKELVACFPKDAGLDEACFKISYDVLIVGVSHRSLASLTTTLQAWVSK
jgi:NADH:ubiquinone reductase (non-electrogenic)